MGKSILIVDDSDDSRELFASTLKFEGFEVEVAADGEEALRILRVRDDFGCVLLDLKMPNMNGLDFLNQLEIEGIATDVPVMLVTAFNGVEDLDLPSNVVDILKKPFFYPELIFKLKQFNFLS